MGRDVYIPERMPERHRSIRKDYSDEENSDEEDGITSVRYNPPPNWGWRGWEIPEVSIPVPDEMPERRIWHKPAVGHEYNVQPKKRPMVDLSNPAYQTIDARV